MSDTRRAMERRLGADFGDVRVHDGIGAVAATRSLGADAYATADDQVVLGADARRNGTSADLLLAHELAHVAQFDGERPTGPEDGPEGKRAPAEREAVRAGLKAAGGETARVSADPTGLVATGTLGWLEERAKEVGSGVSSAASSVTSTASSAASTVGSAATSAGSAVADSSVGSWVSETASSAYSGMQSASESIQAGGKWVEGKIDAGQDWVARQARAGADVAEGVPVLGDVADVAAGAVDKYTGFYAGVAQGATSFGSGLASMIANPVDATRGIYEMGRHVPLPGIVNPFRRSKGVYELLAGNASIGEVANQMLNPAANWESDAEFWKRVGSGLAEPYQRSIGEDDDYAQAVGRGAFDIASLFMGGSGGVVKGGSTAGRVSKVLSKVRRGGKASRTAGKVEDPATVGARVSDETTATSRSARTSGGATERSKPYGHGTEVSASKPKDFITQTGKTEGGQSRVSRTWRQRYGPGVMHDHHLIPQAVLNNQQIRQRLQRIITSRKTSPQDFIDQKVARITNQEHVRIHRGEYNAEWKTWFERNPNFTKADLEAKISEMMKRYKIPKAARGVRKYGRN